MCFNPRQVVSHTPGFCCSHVLWNINGGAFCNKTQWMCPVRNTQPWDFPWLAVSMESSSVGWLGGGGWFCIIIKKKTMGAAEQSTFQYSSWLCLTLGDEKKIAHRCKSITAHVPLSLCKVFQSVDILVLKTVKNKVHGSLVYFTKHMRFNCMISSIFFLWYLPTNLLNSLSEK